MSRGRGGLKWPEGAKELTPLKQDLVLRFLLAQMHAGKIKKGEKEKATRPLEELLKLQNEGVHLPMTDFIGRSSRGGSGETMREIKRELIKTWESMTC